MDCSSAGAGEECAEEVVGWFVNDVEVLESVFCLGDFDEDFVGDLGFDNLSMVAANVGFRNFLLFVRGVVEVVTDVDRGVS